MWKLSKFNSLLIVTELQSYLYSDISAYNTCVYYINNLRFILHYNEVGTPTYPHLKHAGKWLYSSFFFETCRSNYGWWSTSSRTEIELRALLRVGWWWCADLKRNYGNWAWSPTKWMLTPPWAVDSIRGSISICCYSLWPGFYPFHRLVRLMERASWNSL